MLDSKEVLASLTVEEKCALIAGETNWRTPAYPHAGVPQLKMTDGPSGVRGEQLGEQGSAGVSVPSGIALGAYVLGDLTIPKIQNDLNSLNS